MENNEALESNKDAVEKEIVSKNFIELIIDKDLEEGKVKNVVTRFPPEPNGYLHIGHAKSILLNYGLAMKYGGKFNLRFDDTNPTKEKTEFVDSIIEDVKWVGGNFDDRLFFASDYFEQMYEAAVKLIKKGKAFVCDLTAEQIREYRGTLTEPGKNSPYRDRSIEENLQLFEDMKAGKFEDGSKVLRAKIDMTSPNINMRDPVIYRVAKISHHNTGDKWCIYPMYDFAHPIEDAIENITHSLCSLEFEDHRPLYNWFIEHCPVPSKPRQIEFARLNIDYTVMSKRKLRHLVESGVVDGWDDPRMPTLSGLRRRGYTPQSIRNFCDRIGVSKVDSTVSSDFLEFCLREDLGDRALRAMAVVEPLKLVITNYPEGKVENLPLENFPGQPDFGQHEIPFSRELYIERSDFELEPPKKYHRFYVGNEVRLRGAYLVTCTGYDVDENGEVSCIYGEYDPESRGGAAPDGRKVRGTIHWVEANSAIDAELRLYDKLFTVADPDGDEADYTELINPDSLKVTASKVEPWLADANNDQQHFQFMRQGYFVRDNKAEGLVFNRAVGLRDSYNKKQK